MTHELTEPELIQVSLNFGGMLRRMRNQKLPEDIISMTTLGFVGGIRSVKSEMDDEEADLILNSFNYLIKSTRLTGKDKEEMQ